MNQFNYLDNPLTPTNGMQAVPHTIEPSGFSGANLSPKSSTLPPGINNMENLITLILLQNGGVFNANAAGMLLQVLGVPVTPANVNAILNTVLTGTGGNNTAAAVIPFFNHFANAGPETLIQPPSNNHFANIIRDNVPLYARVVDIAMLGAHNAFTSGIEPTSAIDPNDSMYGSDLLALAPGFVSRFARTQYGNAMRLLNNGVRYLDVRVTNVNGEWYTENTMLSTRLSYYISDVIRFLQQNRGELVIFDLQHINFGNASLDQLWSYISGIRVNGQNLFEFVHVNPNRSPLSTLTLGEATRGGTSSGVIILANQPVSESRPIHYDRSLNMRSRWLQQDNIPGLINAIEGEQSLIGDGRYSNILRVNQASLAFGTSGNGLLNSINSWSYMFMAERTNSVLLAQDLNRWLSVTPILMVGFAESAYSNFNSQVIHVINSFNRNLK
ncbi:MAG: hypothetical protein FWG67_03935 [Defluviitaleaceae bacterium]|nr:hypothetical protein [Defluviitaleaceae bacterium]